MFRGRTAETLARAAESYQGIVSLDPNVRPQLIEDRAEWDGYHSRWLTNVDIYKVADEDLEWIWPNRAPEACVEELLSGSAKVVILTRGSSGLSIYCADGEATADAVLVDVVDTVGAGDTVCAVVLASLLNWGITVPKDLEGISLRNWASIAERAAAGAAITCSRAGADTPWPEELADILP